MSEPAKVVSRKRRVPFVYNVPGVRLTVGDCDQIEA